MRSQSIFSSVIAAGLALACVPVGCGGATEDYTVVSPAHEERNTTTGSSSNASKPGLDPTAHQRAEACLANHSQPSSPGRYELRVDAQVNENGVITNVALRNTTLPNDVEVCLRQVIATLTVPEQTLRPRSAQPFSGGERMTREQRGPLGSNDSQNPIVWVFFLTLEAVEIEVSVDVIIGAIVAVGTLAMPRRKDPKKECLDKYEACQDTPLGNLQVDIHGSSVCDTCRKKCLIEGAWPSGFPIVGGWQTCG